MLQRLIPLLALGGTLLLFAAVNRLRPIPGAVVAAVIATITTVLVCYMIRSSPCPASGRPGRLAGGVVLAVIWLAVTVSVVRSILPHRPPEMPPDVYLSRKIVLCTGYTVTTVILWQIARSMRLLPLRRAGRKVKSV